MRGRGEKLKKRVKETLKCIICIIGGLQPQRNGTSSEVLTANGKDLGDGPPRFKFRS